MTKYKERKLKKSHRRRARYTAKRSTLKWKKRKRLTVLRKRSELIFIKKQRDKPFFDLEAPKNFSFIENTNEILEYFDKARSILKSGNNVNFNIDNIENITPDTISIMVAAFNDPEFYGKSICRGDAPKNPSLKNMFEHSGFYKFVNSKHSKEDYDDNLLHKYSEHEGQKKVQPRRAKEACIIGTNYTFGHKNPFDPLYNIIIECMLNTDNHAKSNDKRKCSWWLSAYPKVESRVTAYTFLDLGVGIFKSIKVRKYIKKISQALQIKDNLDLVDDLLSGEIGSSVEKDNKMRGKGIPQIVRCSKLDTFKEFYIVTNDVKMDLKKCEYTKLNSSFKGTLLYWEIQP